MAIRNIRISGADFPRAKEIVTHQALAFIADLHERFERERRACLLNRRYRQVEIDAGKLPDFLPETQEIRESDWKIDPVPAVLQDRRVEITGPASSRKMVINALNSGANVYMADSEDSESPTWANIINGQLNLYDAIRGQVDFKDPASGKEYKLNEKTAVLFYRPRGWHLEEAHMTVNGEPVSASLFDFGMYFFHNAHELAVKGQAPYLYLPKMENHLEARLWAQIFQYAAESMIWTGSVKATCLIETLPAAFEMHEILYELRRYSAGLNCGRWDYIFSYIKKLRNHAQFVLPDRGQVTMDKGFLKAYADLLIQTCHRRGAHAMGGMAAQIPIKNDPTANQDAMAKVRADKAREVKAGHDGTWVAHPALVPLAKEIFDLGMPGPNQLHVLREDVNVSARDLLEPIQGTITLNGIRKNVEEGVFYNYHWLNGNGAAVINYLMSDAATTEISRSQLWQWLKHRVKLENGIGISEERIAEALAEVYKKAFADKNLTDNFEDAVELFMDMVMADDFEEFLTTPAYKALLNLEQEKS